MIAGTTLTVDAGASLTIASGGTFGGQIVNAVTGYQVNGLAPSGYVLRGNGTNFVAAQLNYSDLIGSPTIALANDSDVLITSPTNGQVLAYNSVAGKWENSNAAAGAVTSVGTGGIATGGPITSSGTVTVAGSGNTSTAATAAANLAAAANGIVVITDGHGNVQSSGTLLSTLSSFTSFTSGTNTTASMIISTGASLSFSGSGILNASQINGITVTGTPSAGQVITATSGSAANWQTVSGGGGGSSTLAGDTDVIISSPADGQVLSYNASAGKWENSAPTSGGTVTSVSGASQQGVETLVSGSVAAITGAGIVRGSILFVSKTGNQTYADSDRGHFWLSADSANDAYIFPVPSGSNFQNGWYVYLKNGSSSNTIALNANAGSLIDGAASVTLPAHTCVMIQCDGTNYHTTSISPVGNNNANLAFLSPNGVSGFPSMRSVVAADLTSAIFGASGGSHSIGVVPDPGSSAGTKRFLREDSSWQHLSTAHVMGEVPGGTIDGSNVTFTLANTPATGTLALYQSGQRLAGGGADYTISGSTITFTTAPPVQSPVVVLIADYIL